MNTALGVCAFLAISLLNSGCATTAQPQASRTAPEMAPTPPETASVPIPERFLVSSEGAIAITIVGEVIKPGTYFVPRGSTLQEIVGDRDTDRSPLRPDIIGNHAMLSREGKIISARRRFTEITESPVVELRAGDVIFVTANCVGI